VVVKNYSLRDVDAVADVLLAGGVVIIPTDTVYGIAARVADADAVARLFAVKRRPQSVALPVFVENLEGVVDAGGRLPVSAQTLAHAFWPGALTLVIPALATMAERVGSSTGTIGFRLPDDDFVQELVVRTGPLAVTSANEHGEAPLTTPEQVRSTFDSADIDAWVDGGIREGLVSTVVACRDDGYEIVRLGALDNDTIASAFR
jgi:tRNA threonylcarbamoyl adenosine modification protein (Sua5/YciO/YrdC/YwlC family)